MVSVSDLVAYLYCKRKLYLQRVLKKEEAPRNFLVLGNIKHAFYDFANNFEKEIISEINSTDSFEEMLEKYRGKYYSNLQKILAKYASIMRAVKLPLSEASKELQSCMLAEAELRAKNVFDFAKKSGLSGSALWEMLSPKIKTEYFINAKEIDLIGKIDRVEIHNSFVVPVELKTGKAPKEGVWENHRIQLSAYALLLEKKFDARVDKGFVAYLDLGEKREVAINRFMKEEVLELVAKVKALLAGGVIPERESNENKCKNCGLRDVCFNNSEIEKTKVLNTS